MRTRLPGARRVLRAVLLLVAAGVIAAAGAALGAVAALKIAERWPIDAVESILRRLGVDRPADVWEEFTRSDLPRYEMARVVDGGTVYLIGGFWTSDIKASARVEALDIATGAWRRMKDMPVPLTHAPAALLQGRVWMAGGFEGDHPGTATARVWQWDPRTDTWSNGPPLPGPRGGGALVALGGALHYFGGFMADRNTDSPDHWVLQPGATTWQPRAPLPTPRGHLSGIALGEHIYAISGNRGHDPIPVDLATVERYDPATDTWAAMPSTPFPVSHTEASTFVYDQRVVTIGGRSLDRGMQDQDDVIAFHPPTGRWSHLGHIPEKQLGMVGFAFGDSAYAGLGAVAGSRPSNPQFWRSSLRNTWRLATELPRPLGEVAAGIVGDSLFIVGQGSPFTMRYDLAAGVTERLASVRPAVGNHHAAEVIDNRVWLFGGLDAGSGGVVQIFDPAAGTWTLGPPMPFAAGSSSSAVIGGRVYVAGGIVNRHTTSAAAVFDPASGTWASIAPMPRPRNHTASGTDGSRFFVFGGRGPGSGDDNVVANGFDDVQIYDPQTNQWRVSDGTPGAPARLPQARGGMGKAVWLDGEFWVFGGETEDGPGATGQRVYARVDIYNPATNRWRAGPPMRRPRHGIFPVVHDGQIIVAAGGVKAADSRSALIEVLWPRMPAPGDVGN
jgi:N-acetylneuraminic acid mutarotase